LSEFATDSDQFNLRVAGVCIRDGHVLLHREENDDVWVLPGGRPLLHEPSRETLVREMWEVIAREIDVGRLLWIVENFFSFQGRRFHELSLYYEMHLGDNGENPTDLADFTGKESEITLLFHWMPLDQIAQIDLKPTFLKTALRDLPSTPIHLVHTDPGA
jgi:ADP-ribose pyrophosphatase YjhB (NUDIX family)